MMCFQHRHAHFPQNFCNKCQLGLLIWSLFCTLTTFCSREFYERLGNPKTYPQHYVLDRLEIWLMTWNSVDEVQSTVKWCNSRTVVLGKWNGTLSCCGVTHSWNDECVTNVCAYHYNIYGFIARQCTYRYC